MGALDRALEAVRDHRDLELPGPLDLPAPLPTGLVLGRRPFGMVAVLGAEAGVVAVDLGLDRVQVQGPFDARLLPVIDGLSAAITPDVVPVEWPGARGHGFRRGTRPGLAPTRRRTARPASNVAPHARLLSAIRPDAAADRAALLLARGRPIEPTDDDPASLLEAVLVADDGAAADGATDSSAVLDGVIDAVSSATPRYRYPRALQLLVGAVPRDPTRLLYQLLSSPDPWTEREEAAALELAGTADLGHVPDDGPDAVALALLGDRPDMARHLLALGCRTGARAYTAYLRPSQ